MTDSIRTFEKTHFTQKSRLKVDQRKTSKYNRLAQVLSPNDDFLARPRVARYQEQDSVTLDQKGAKVHRILITTSEWEN